MYLLLYFDYNTHCVLHYYYIYFDVFFTWCGALEYANLTR